MDGFTLLQLGGVDSANKQTRAANVAVEIEKNCRLTFECDEMFGRYAILLNKFKSQDQLYFAAKVNLIK